MKTNVFICHILNRFVWSWSFMRKYCPLTGSVGRPYFSAGLQESSCKRGHFVHVGFGSHTQPFKDPACASIWAEPANLMQLF